VITFIILLFIVLELGAMVYFLEKINTNLSEMNGDWCELLQDELLYQWRQKWDKK